MRHLGARPSDQGSCAFTVWAPDCRRVTIDIVGAEERCGIEMTKDASGYHRAVVDRVPAGALYFYRLDDGPRRPDPVSRFQPQGVHGPSQVIDPDFAWSDQDWVNPERDQLIIYELHVGTFTDEGTFASAIRRLPELVELGITAIELMPVAASAGRWNWGYDGVALFAPTAAYGTPKDFRRFVDAAHQHGLAVFLDVVYNHLGPEGNYLAEFGPYFSSKHHTVWGDAPNFDDETCGDAVRNLVTTNAIYWLDEFHLDGLRVDAIHCMHDDRVPHIAAEMAERVADWSARSNRRVTLIAESNVYDPEMTLPLPDGGIGFDAMWCDDFLHSVFAVLRPGEQVCHRNYIANADLERTLVSGFVYEGTLRQHRQRRIPDERVATHGMVFSIQNHDFIGNHPLGGRLHQLTSEDAHRAAATLMLLHPAIPMLFMGEEFACDNPFRFFVDFSDAAVRNAVVEGRRREYPQHDWDGGVSPVEPDAFYSAKIGDRSDGNPMTLDWYKRLIALRKSLRQNGLLTDAHLKVETDAEKGLFQLHYSGERETLSVIVRLTSASEPADRIPYDADGEVLLNSRAGTPWDGHLDANHALVLRKR